MVLAQQVEWTPWDYAYARAYAYACACHRLRVDRLGFPERWASEHVGDYDADPDDTIPAGSTEHPGAAGSTEYADKSAFGTSTEHTPSGAHTPV